MERVGELQASAARMILLANKRIRSLAEESKRPTESEVRGPVCKNMVFYGLCERIAAKRNVPMAGLKPLFTLSADQVRDMIQQLQDTSVLANEEVELQGFLHLNDEYSALASYARPG